MSWRHITSFLRSTTARLAASYLAIIMILSIGFSGVLYQASSHEFGRQLPPISLFSENPDRPNISPDYNHFFQDRINEGREAILTRLIMLNIVVLALGSGLSYYLARRTLQPIEAAMDAQSRFVTDASHELRTPLTAMLATNEVALRNRKLTLPDAKAVIASNSEEVIKLQNLTEGLLGLAKQDAQLLTLEPTPLQPVVSEALTRVVASAQAKHISIEDKVPNMSVKGNAACLEQALVILLDNAIKYSPDKTAITVTAATKGKLALIAVRDHGSGISPLEIPFIFDRFYRADASRTESGANGYGIGLSIAKHIAAQHHGSLSVESELGKGSTFTLAVPLNS